MTARSSLPQFLKLSPATIDGLRAISDGTKASGLEPRLIELVKVRVSQLNGCAYCLARHVDESHKAGIDDRTLHLLAAWREADLFSQRERAALAWAEAVTLISQGPVEDNVYEQASAQFTPDQLADLTGAVVSINGFNRVAVAYRFALPKM